MDHSGIFATFIAPKSNSTSFNAHSKAVPGPWLVTSRFSCFSPVQVLVKKEAQIEDCLDAHVDSMWMT